MSAESFKQSLAQSRSTMQSAGKNLKTLISDNQNKTTTSTKNKLDLAFLSALEMAKQSAIEEVPATQIITAEIVEHEENTNKYKLKYLDTNILEAITNGKEKSDYEIGDIVKAVIPNGDASETLIIIGLYVESESEQDSITEDDFYEQIGLDLFKDILGDDFNIHLHSWYKEKDKIEITFDNIVEPDENNFGKIYLISPADGETEYDCTADDDFALDSQKVYSGTNEFTIICETDGTNKVYKYQFKDTTYTDNKIFNIRKSSFAEKLADVVTREDGYYCPAVDVFTDINPNYQGSGNYGVLVEIPVKTPELNENGETISTIVKYETIALFDTTTMLGNIYNFTQKNTQKLPVTALEQKLENIITRGYTTSTDDFDLVHYPIKLVGFVDNNFSYPDNYDPSDYKEELLYDIDFDNLKLYEISIVPEEFRDGYYFHIIAPDTGKLITNNQDFVTLIPSLKNKMKSVKDLDKKYYCYWFKKNSSITQTSPEYLPIGKIGWECLNEISDVDGRRIGTKFSLTIPSDEVYISASYKCILVPISYSEEEAEALDVETAYFSDIAIVKNIFRRGSVTLKTLPEKKANVAFPSVGNITLEATLDCPGITDHEGSIVNINWSRYNEKGILILNDESTFTIDPDKGVQIKDNKYIYTYLMPANVIPQDSANTVMVSFSTKVEDSYVELGEDSILIRVGTYSDYSLIIYGGDLFKYDRYGNAPTLESYAGLGHQIVFLPPYTFEVVDKDGKQLTKEDFAGWTYHWYAPKNSLLVFDIDNLSSQFDIDTESDPDYYILSSKIYSTSALTYTLEKNYDKTKGSCNVIKLALENPDGFIMNQSYQVSFVKDGYAGTNGSNYSAVVRARMVLKENIDFGITPTSWGTGEKGANGFEYGEQSVATQDTVNRLHKLQAYYYTNAGGNPSWHALFPSWIECSRSKIDNIDAWLNVTSLGQTFESNHLQPIFEVSVYKEGKEIAPATEASTTNGYTVEWSMMADNTKKNRNAKIAFAIDKDTGYLRLKNTPDVTNPNESTWTYNQTTGKYDSFFNVVQAKIKVGNAGNLTDGEDNLNNFEYLYAYYPIEVTYIVDRNQIPIPNNIDMFPQLQGGFSEVIYRSDGTNPEYVNNEVFILTNYKNYGDTELFGYHWSSSKNLYFTDEKDTQKIYNNDQDSPDEQVPESYIVIEPIGTENPYAEGWYEKVEDEEIYILTEDTVVNILKTYYIKAEDGLSIKYIKPASTFDNAITANYVKIQYGRNQKKLEKFIEQKQEFEQDIDSIKEKYGYFKGRAEALTEASQDYINFKNADYNISYFYDFRYKYILCALKAPNSDFEEGLLDILKNIKDLLDAHLKEGQHTFDYDFYKDSLEEHYDAFCNLNFDSDALTGLPQENHHFILSPIANSTGYGYTEDSFDDPSALAFFNDYVNTYNNKLNAYLDTADSFAFTGSDAIKLCKPQVALNQFRSRTILTTNRNVEVIFPDEGIEDIVTINLSSTFNPAEDGVDYYINKNYLPKLDELLRIYRVNEVPTWKDVENKLLNPLFSLGDELKNNINTFYSNLFNYKKEILKDLSEISTLEEMLGYMNNLARDIVHIRPILCITNTSEFYGLHGWDGQSAIVKDDEGFEALYHPQVGAGEWNNETNSFLGLVIGKKQYINPRTNKAYYMRGMFGYGPNQQGGSGSQQTLMLNSDTGQFVLGGRRDSQIIIDPLASPDPNSEPVGLIYGGGFYKPRDIADENGSWLPASYDHKNESGKGLLINFSKPEIRFGNGNYELDNYGNMYAAGIGRIAGWTLTDNEITSVEIDPETGEPGRNSKNGLHLISGYKVIYQKTDPFTEEVTETFDRDEADKDESGQPIAFLDRNKRKQYVVDDLHLPAIYSQQHDTLLDDSHNGFYLSQEGLSIFNEYYKRETVNTGEYETVEIQDEEYKIYHYNGTLTVREEKDESSIDFDINNLESIANIDGMSLMAYPSNNETLYKYTVGFEDCNLKEGITPFQVKITYDCPWSITNETYPFLSETRPTSSDHPPYQSGNFSVYFGFSGNGYPPITYFGTNCNVISIPISALKQKLVSLNKLEGNNITILFGDLEQSNINCTFKVDGENIDISDIVQVTLNKPLKKIEFNTEDTDLCWGYPYPGAPQHYGYCCIIGTPCVYQWSTTYSSTPTYVREDGDRTLTNKINKTIGEISYKSEEPYIVVTEYNNPDMVLYPKNNPDEKPRFFIYNYYGENELIDLKGKYFPNQTKDSQILLSAESEEAPFISIGEHRQLTSKKDGIYLGENGISLGSKFKVLPDGKTYIGAKASELGGTEGTIDPESANLVFINKHWIIDGDNNEDSSITFNTDGIHAEYDSNTGQVIFPHSDHEINWYDKNGDGKRGSKFYSNSIYMGTDGFRIGNSFLIMKDKMFLGNILNPQRRWEFSYGINPYIGWGCYGDSDEAIYSDADYNNYFYKETDLGYGFYDNEPLDSSSGLKTFGWVMSTEYGQPINQAGSTTGLDNIPITDKADGGSSNTAIGIDDPAISRQQADDEDVDTDTYKENSSVLDMIASEIIKKNGTKILSSDYTTVSDPTGNPKAQLWFEVIPDTNPAKFQPTADISVQTGKVYYEVKNKSSYTYKIQRPSSNSIYLGLNGLRLGRQFAVSKSGVLYARAGTIGGWTFDKDRFVTTLSEQWDGKYASIQLMIERNVDLQTFKFSKKKKDEVYYIENDSTIPHGDEMNPDKYMNLFYQPSQGETGVQIPSYDTTYPANTCFQVAKQGGKYLLKILSDVVASKKPITYTLLDARNGMYGYKLTWDKNKSKWVEKKMWYLRADGKAYIRNYATKSYVEDAIDEAIGVVLQTPT